MMDKILHICICINGIGDFKTGKKYKYAQCKYAQNISEYIIIAQGDKSVIASEESFRYFFIDLVEQREEKLYQLLQA